jgi:hypothetical protein
MCKCYSCKKMWDDKDVKPDQYLEATKCPNSRHYKAAEQ